MSSDLVLVNGTMYWTTSNGIQTFLGPVRHARTRSTMKARDIAAALRRKTTPSSTPPLDPSDTTVVLPVVPDESATATIPPCDWCAHGECPKHSTAPTFLEQTEAGFKALEVPTIVLPQVEAPKHYRGRSRRVGRLARIREDITDALYDDAWQKMARNTALTIGSYVSLVGGSMMLGKVVWWVLTLSL